MTAPMRPPTLLRQQSPEEQQLASEKRRVEAMREQKLEDVLEAEAKSMLSMTCEKMSERTARFKAIAMFLAIKNKLGPVWGAALDEEEAS